MTTWDEGWHCSCCSNFNWSRYKACQKCSAKKAFAMGPRPVPFVQLPPWAPKQPPGPPPVGFKGLVQHLPVPAAAMIAATPAGVAAVAPPATTTPTTASRGALHSRIRCLEAALAALPPPTSLDDDCYKIPRDELMKQIAALKRQMIDAKPIGARIDGCRAALTRAMKRRDSGHEALHAAQAVVTAADIEVATLEIDLQTLEVELQSSTEAEPETAESLITVEAGCARLISRLQENDVQEYTVLEAKKLVDNLVSGFKQLLAITNTPGSDPPPAAQDPAAPVDPSAPSAPRAPSASRTPVAAAPAAPAAGAAPVTKCTQIEDDDDDLTGDPCKDKKDLPHKTPSSKNGSLSSSSPSS